ncbi:RNA polymerase sigma factor [Nocardioides panacisoli]|uniref:Sigma factor-like helix-turn-helix DNA-binding protein n=1 Tax=Nocardioides panacisoli TaxID=627624 RepID=A0ABP7HVP9_9ACTN
MTQACREPREASLSVDTALEQALRDEWGRIVALLVAHFRRLDLAEDALADAFEAAARTWPETGVPANPAGWLLTTSRRRALDRLRSERVLARSMPLLEVEADLAQDAQRVLVDPGDELRDERLRLVLLCTHPRLSREAAAALTLRLVLGVPTPEVARLFLQSPATMAARLTRARKKLAGERLGVPSGSDLTDRVARVADVAYLAFTAGYAPGTGPDVVRADLAGEAIRLVRALRSLLPYDDPELDALQALMLLQHARRAARVSGDRLVLLPDQDRSLWRQEEIGEALTLLAPLAVGAPAPYLLQALIAAEHAIAASAEDTAWDRIVARYDELLTLGDSPVVRLNRAVALAEARGPEAGLDALAGLAVPGHRLPAVRAQLLARTGDHAGARTAYDTAIALCANEVELAVLREQRAALGA